MIVHNFIKEFLSFFKIVKTPLYIKIDYEDIKDSQIVASAKKQRDCEFPLNLY